MLLKVWGLFCTQVVHGPSTGRSYTLPEIWTWRNIHICVEFMPVYNCHLENYLIVLRFCFVLWQKFKELMMRNHVQFESNPFLNCVSGT